MVLSKKMGSDQENHISQSCHLKEKVLPGNKASLGSDRWPEVFFEKTAGSFTNAPLLRQPQGEFDKRSNFK